MSVAAISVAALFVAIIVSCVSRVNVGVLSIVLAYIVGVYFGGMKFDEIAAGFPAQLFLTLTGVTLLFAQAQTNGTLDRIAHRAVRICRGNAGLIAPMFFMLGAGLASIGPGNIATAALLAPMAMSVAARASIPAFLMAIMIGNGANAGSLSPFAPTGVIVNGLMARIGIPGHEWLTWWNNLAAHAAIAFTGYFLFGGWKLFRLRYEQSPNGETPSGERFEPAHWITIAVIAALIITVAVFKISLGVAAFAGAVILVLAGAADHADAIKRMPWSVIMMVSGVTVLISLLEKTQGIAIFTDLIARLATKETITAVVAFLTGAISVYSSTSGVVLPAFLPVIPGLVQRLGGGDVFAIASSMNVGGHLVDVSPLSTIGALCLAAAPAAETRALFNKLLAWGLSMTIVGALTCWLIFGR